MALSIQERIRDLRVERKLTLEQLAELTGFCKTAGGYSNLYRRDRIQTDSEPERLGGRNKS